MTIYGVFCPVLEGTFMNGERIVLRLNGIESNQIESNMDHCTLYASFATIFECGSVLREKDEYSKA